MFTGPILVRMEVVGELVLRVRLATTRDRAQAEVTKRTKGVERGDSQKIPDRCVP